MFCVFYEDIIPKTIGKVKENPGKTSVCMGETHFFVLQMLWHPLQG